MTYGYQVIFVATKYKNVSDPGVSTSTSRRTENSYQECNFNTQARPSIKPTWWYHCCFPVCSQGLWLAIKGLHQRLKAHKRWQNLTCGVYILWHHKNDYMYSVFHFSATWQQKIFVNIFRLTYTVCLLWGLSSEPYLLAHKWALASKCHCYQICKQFTFLY